MNELFKNIVGNKPKTNWFNLSHERKFSMKMGQLVPILCEEVIPGDTWNVNTEVLMRLAPMVAPVMHRVNVYTHFFFVPNRLIWSEWEDFITGGEDGTEEPVRPYKTFTGVSAYMEEGSLADYLGFSSEPIGGSVNINVLPFRAYQLVFNEYYRDQNLETAVAINKTSGLDSLAASELMVVRTRAWEKDYFTSALPWTQRGAEVELPLGTAAPIYATDDVYDGSATTNWTVYDSSGNPVDGTVSSPVNIEVGPNTNGPLRYVQGAAHNPAWLDPDGNLEADLSSATGATIEELRRATKLQAWLERSARGGARYIEKILSHFGVHSSDKRLQRPEFLGGGKSPIVISEVLQTSETDAGTPQGNPAGHGIAVGNTHQAKKYFEEHGYIIGIISVLPKTAYQQGTRKHLLKDDKFDYYWPEFAQLGEQAVLQAEVYDDYVTANREATFGYQSRYAEYKYIPSSVHGDFKDDLSFWHMGRIFSSAPALNETFIQADTSAINTRVFAAGDTEPQLWVQVYNNIKAKRPIPKFNNPSLI